MVFEASMNFYALCPMRAPYVLCTGSFLFCVSVTLLVSGGLALSASKAMSQDHSHFHRTKSRGKRI